MNSDPALLSELAAARALQATRYTEGVPRLDRRFGRRGAPAGQSSQEQIVQVTGPAAGPVYPGTWYDLIAESLTLRAGGPCWVWPLNGAALQEQEFYAGRLWADYAGGGSGSGSGSGSGGSGSAETLPVFSVGAGATGCGLEDRITAVCPVFSSGAFVGIKEQHQHYDPATCKYVGQAWCVVRTDDSACCPACSCGALALLVTGSGFSGPFAGWSCNAPACVCGWAAAPTLQADLSDGSQVILTWGAPPGLPPGVPGGFYGFWKYDALGDPIYLRVLCEGSPCAGLEMPVEAVLSDGSTFGASCGTLTGCTPFGLTGALSTAPAVTYSVSVVGSSSSAGQGFNGTYQLWEAADGWGYACPDGASVVAGLDADCVLTITYTAPDGTTAIYEADSGQDACCGTVTAYLVGGTADPADVPDSVTAEGIGCPASEGGGSGSGSGSGSGGGCPAGENTLLCFNGQCFNDSLTATLADASCAGLDGVTIALTSPGGGDDWTGSGTLCGSAVTAVVTCSGAGAVLRLGHGVHVIDIPLSLGAGVMTASVLAHTLTNLLQLVCPSCSGTVDITIR